MDCHETNKNYSMDSYMGIEPVCIGPLWVVIVSSENSLLLKGRTHFRNKGWQVSFQVNSQLK